MRIAWFSPLAPDASKAAYATRVLLPLLERWCEIDLYHDSLAEFEGRRVHPFLSAFSRHQHTPYDLFFYQLEDGRHSYFSRIHLGVIPGVVWFHDLLLSDYGPEPILNSAWQETVQKFRDRTRPWCAHDMKHTPKGPHAHREAALAGIKIFSSERDHNEYRRCMETSLLPLSARSYYVPLPAPAGSTAAIAEDKAASDTTRVVFCGAPRIEDRAEALLEALLRAQQHDTTKKITLTWLIDPSERSEAEALIQESGARGVTLHEGRTPEIWQTIVRNGDLAIHTRFSVFGQLGPYLNVSLSEGVPSVVVNFGSGELLPESLVLKISSGRAGVNELRDLITHAPSIKRAKGSDIATYGRELFDSESIARELLSVFEASAPTLKALHARWGTFEQEAKKTLAHEAQELFENDLFGSGKLQVELLQPVYKELGWS